MVFKVIFFHSLHFDSSGSTREKGRPHMLTIAINLASLITFLAGLLKITVS